ncbi:MAG: sensor domain-containing diguanylate cyclase [Motiliproteus sp.]|nr:sensor domain-containing diguanylate cyclase [Motiliproteus sp.]MCW9053350.1 sensor domain-containing diguanylate cyclase [Motiliproteus sp.]
MGLFDIDHRHPNTQPTNGTIISTSTVLRFLIIFLPFAAATVSGALLLYWIESSAYLSKQKTRQLLSAQLGVEHMGVELKSIADDLAYLASAPGLRKSIDSLRPNLEANWINFLGNKNLYDQVRLIDPLGQEQIRVNYNRGLPQAVPLDKLQNKSNRYYFSETMTLNQGQFFVSQLDLNVEKGSIERPYKPTLRIATPLIHDNGQRAGIVILNILGQHILDAYTAISSESADKAWLVNQQGYWLKGPDQISEWGFMFQRHDSRLSVQYPKAWKIISSNERGQFENSLGLWSYESAHPTQFNGLSNSNDAAPKQIWKAVRFIAKSALYRYPKKIAAILSIAVSLLLLVSFYVSYRLAMAWASQQQSNLTTQKLNENLEQEVQQRTAELQWAKQQAEQLARTDELTGINNHRAFYQHAMELHQRSVRYGNPYSIIIFDLDHFKHINDSHGHLVGDQVLKIIGKLTSQVIRRADIAGRIGGEEFAIILPETSSNEAYELAERLRTQIASAALNVNQQSLRFTASFGLSQFCQGDSSFESVIKRSDDALYTAKSKGRNRVVINQSVRQAACS